MPLGPPVISVIAADSGPAPLEKADAKAPLQAKPLTAAVHHSADDICVETPPELLEEPVAPDSSVEPAVEPGDLGERSSIAAEVREIAPDDFFHCFLMRLSVQEPKPFQWHIEPIIFKSIPCLMFAIGPSSFQRGFDIVVFLTWSQTCQTVSSLVNRLLSITWLFRSLLVGRRFLY